MAPLCEPLCHFGGRLFFTSFPHPPPRSDDLNRHAEDPDNHPQIRNPPAGTSPATPDDDAKYYYFTVDDELNYLSFFQDWGPLNLAMVYKACILMHELLQDNEISSHRLVLYSSNDPRKKANAALLMALYVMIVQQKAPWEAFNPIAELEFMPFRDAGRGRSDFNLSIQDCLWGFYKAMQNKLLDMNEFDVRDYEFYEKVENGDWNWLTPNFIAFASPVDPLWIKREKEKKDQDSSGVPSSPDKSSHLALQRKLPQPFNNCLDYFENSNVKLVIRLNNPLYDRQVFLDRGINHEEMYFDDGTNPDDDIVRKFIDMADEVVEAGGVVAVHCKAGLGRTGTLIGAYLVWKYGFTASEAIAFMRIVRPGSVVGPQQQFMYVKQTEWCRWSAIDEMRKLQAESAAATIAVVAPATPPAEVDEQMDTSDTSTTVTKTLVTVPATPMHIVPVTPSRHVAAATAKARAISPPGQPRKTPAAKRVASDSDSDLDEANDVLPALRVAASPVRRVKAKPAATRTSARTSGTRVTSSEQRPTRVLRSQAPVRSRTIVTRAGTSTAKANTTTKTSTTAKASGQSPNKIPRLANGTSARSTNTLPAASKETAVPVPTTLAAQAAARRLRQSPSPTPPSRLPTLVGAKRAHANSTVSGPSIGGRAGAMAAPDAWMKKDAASIVVPGTKSEKPSLRPTRRRRSSLSAVDIVA